MKKTVYRRPNFRDVRRPLRLVHTCHMLLNEAWAQSYQPQIPENFHFSEPKILFVIEATIMVRKLNFF